MDFVMVGWKDVVLVALTVEKWAFRWVACSGDLKVGLTVAGLASWKELNLVVRKETTKVVMMGKTKAVVMAVQWDSSMAGNLA